MAGSSTTHKALSLTVTDADAMPVGKVKVTRQVSKKLGGQARRISKKLGGQGKPKVVKSTKKQKTVKKVTGAEQVKKKKVIKKKTVVKKTVVKKPKKVVKKVTPKKTARLISKKLGGQAKPLTKAQVTKHMKREPLGHLLVEQLLREAGFRGTVSTSKDILEKYSTDESIFSIRPQIVIHPRHQKDVETATKVLEKETRRFPSLSLTPRAAGTGLSGGSLTDSIVIDVCTHMDDIDDVIEKKGKMTFTCQPGAMLRDIEKKLKKHNAYLPPYPASKDICSIGGSVANNAAGPDSLRFGHMASWVESLDVTLYDGNTYTIAPLTFKEFKKLTKSTRKGTLKNAHASIAEQVFALIQNNEKLIKDSKPKTKKNSAGYALWNVLDVSIAQFKKGHGTFDLTQLISGSQGTIGVITSITMRAEKIADNTSLMVIPLFDLADAGPIVLKALEYDPLNLEIFDGPTFELALKNPNFFKERMTGFDYYKALLSMYTTYHVRYGRKTPDFTLLVTLDNDNLPKKLKTILKEIREVKGKKARIVASPAEREMLWQIRRASYTLSKLADPTKRPAAFLEDVTVPPKNLSKFLKEIQKLLRKYKVNATVHGHGGNGHFHFYPLLDFTSNATPALIEKMADDFFATAVKYDGSICGEHNDGIIRTPHLSTMFKKKTLDLFKHLEHIFDPDDIFNPGKKVNPRFDIKESIRKIN